MLIYSVDKELFKEQDNVSVGSRLLYLRKRRKKTQKEIAKILNVTEKTYLLYEKDCRDIPSRIAIALSLYYDVSTDFILKGVSRFE